MKKNLLNRNLFFLILKNLFPVILTIALFLVAFYFTAIPSFKQTMILHKRDLVKDMTSVAWEILNHYQRLEKGGQLSRQEAQTKAKEDIRSLRYGYEKKDYFWICDVSFRAVMQPYRPDHEGKDQSGLTDPTGKKIFVEFIKKANEEGEGFVDYYWQWQDDVTKIVPKISYVKKFAPWGWVIGTGIYIEDVQKRLAVVTQRIRRTFTLIIIFLLLLSAYMVVHGMRVEKARKKAEVSLAESEERLRQAQKMEAIGQLAGGVAHDFNNMLAGIIGNAELLKTKFQKNREAMEYVHHVIEISLRAAELNSQLLAFARRGKIQQVFIDIHDVIGKTIKMLENTIDRRIVISRHLVAKPSIISGDPNQLQNAILNVAINARDAMPQGGKLLFATKVKKLSAAECREFTYKIIPGDYVEVSISDTGMGMGLETQKNIFEPFFTTKELGRGTGLGLSAVDGIVRDHHGAIGVRSKLAQGTDFRLYFPLTTSAEKEPSLTGEKTLADQIVRGEGHVLVVDDEKAIRQMVTDMLTEIGYRVTSAANGERAVEIFREKHSQIDLVLLDLIMPKKDGLDTFKELFGIDPAVKVLLTSGYQQSIKIQEMLDKGACGFINKPYLFSQLSTQIAEILQKKAVRSKS